MNSSEKKNTPLRIILLRIHINFQLFINGLDVLVKENYLMILIFQLSLSLVLKVKNFLQPR